MASYAQVRATTARGENGKSYDSGGRAVPESLTLAGADYDRIAGIRELLRRHNFGAAYGHNLIGNSYGVRHRAHSLLIVM